MPRVDVTVTGRFLQPGSGTPAVGVVKFVLPQPLVDPIDDFTIEPVLVEAPLDIDGRLSTVLSTVGGVDAVYQATISLIGARPRQFRFAVPSTGGTVELADVQTITHVQVATVPVPSPRITVAPTPPPDPRVNDIWVDTSP